MSDRHSLDADILRCIEQRAVADFDALALRIFQHQLLFNEPYAAYCRRLGVTREATPASWDQIPPIPAAAYKEAALCTFDPHAAQLKFETSGTTGTSGGVHYMENAELYDAALLAGFSDRFLRGEPEEFRFFLLVPNPAGNARSSLGYMMQRVAAAYGRGEARWFLEGDAIAADRFVHDLRGMQAARVPVFLAGTGFAFVTLLDALRERTKQSFELPAGSWIMETGGFKGRSRTLSRDELYGDLQRTFGVPEDRIVSEYGMTELSSQYYDAPDPASRRERIKTGPPWLRSYAVGIDGVRLPDGTVGALVHVDLANRSSCVAVQTEDLGAVRNGGIVLIGRGEGSELRGCSLDAEALRVAR